MRFFVSSKKFAICVIFLVSGVLCGLLTARLPALNAQAGLTLADVGMVLFVFGCTCCASLLMVDVYLKRFGSFRLICCMTPVCILAISILGFSHGIFSLYAAAVVLGHALSTLDVTMNTQAMIYEIRTKSSAMSLFHAFYGIGVILAGFFSAIFSHFHVSVGLNLSIVSLMSGLLLYFVAPALYRRDEVEKHGIGRKRCASPLDKEARKTIAVIGIMVLLMYCAEGIVTDWGSLYMVQEKGAPHSLAAMTYGVFSCMSVALSLVGDSIRNRYGDFLVMAASVVVATLGMLAVVLSPGMYGTLFGYAISGAGLALMVPILFSLAGHTPGVGTQYASARVSVYAYTGILFFPPLIGLLAERIGMQVAMSLVFPMFILFIGCLLWLRKRKFNTDGKSAV